MLRRRTAGSTSECEGREIGHSKGDTIRIDLCVNERTVRRTSIPESQRDEPGRGGIDHRVEESMLYWAGQMSFGDSSTTRGT